MLFFFFSFMVVWLEKMVMMVEKYYAVVTLMPKICKIIYGFSLSEEKIE